MIKTAFLTGGSGFVGRNLIQKLVKEGWKVNALARSKEAQNIVEKLGAIAIIGDLSNEEALLNGCQNCAYVFHIAAKADLVGKLEDFMKANVEGTENVLKAAKEAKVQRFIHCSTEAVLAGEKPIENADETWDYPKNPAGFYPLTKGLAERKALAANAPDAGFVTVVCRPRLIWGLGDSVLLPKFIEAVKNGTWKWFSGGTYKTSTCHVRNVCEGLVKAAEFGVPGEKYFLTDGKPVEMKQFFTRYLETQKVSMDGIGSVPFWVARIGAYFEISGLNQSILQLIAQTCTVVDTKARKELNYTSHVSMDEGFLEMCE